MRRREFVALVGGVVAWPGAVLPQHQIVQVDALLLSSDSFFVSRRKQLIALAARYALPLSLRFPRVRH